MLHDHLGRDEMMLESGVRMQVALVACALRRCWSAQHARERSKNTGDAHRYLHGCWFIRPTYHHAFQVLD